MVFQVEMRNVNGDLIPALISATNYNVSKNEGLWSLCSWITCKLEFTRVGDWVNKEQNTQHFLVLKVVFQTQNFRFYSKSFELVF